ncbi:LPS biosynthesis protein [Oceaniferula spumae]|uniref:LPS biosynthesis protein n=1 Tax=Oceaniferula spumae TaxID=2979115 RepID=A0AAT9FNQ6_9BACT
MQNLPWDGLTRNLHFDLGWSLLPFTPFTLGWHGVAVFFAISGYCIQLSWLQGNRSWISFGKRRFYRLFPTYLVWLLIFTLLAWLLPNIFTFKSDITQFVTHALLIHNWSGWTLWGINPSFWSIAVEIQLYALLPALVWMAHRFSWGKALAVTAVIEVLLRFPWQWIVGVDAGTYLPEVNVLGVTLAYWFSWSMGAWVASRQYAGAPQPLAKLPLLLAVLSVLVCWYIKPLSGYSFMAASFATCVWITKKLNNAEKTAEQPSLGTKRSQNPLYGVLSVIGVCSYSLYLLHQPLMVAFNTLFIRDLGIHTAVKMLIHMGVLLPVLSLIAYCSYQVIEKPTAMWGRKP